MTIEVRKKVEPAIILSLHQLGFKVVPLSRDSKIPAIKWAPVYDSGWSINELSQNYDSFENIATCFGKSHLRDDKGKDTFLNCLDIDSEKVYYELFNAQKRSFTAWAVENTYCTKTHKPNGWHIYWFSHEQNVPIKTKRCRPSYEFEIKTDKSSGLATLPPSIHRDDVSFKYRALGKDTIIVSDEAYPNLLKVLGQFVTPESAQTADPLVHLDADNATTIELTEEDVVDIATDMHKLYKKNLRNALCLALAGHLHKSTVGLISAKSLFERITSEDDEKKSRLLTLYETYKKKRSEVSGFSALFYILAKASNEKVAKKIMNNIQRFIKPHKRTVSDAGLGAERPKELPIELTEELMKEVAFKDIGEVLSTSIKKDEAAKLITFCGMILAQTENDQVNVGFQSKSATGKSYIPIEIAAYFPANEVIKIASASPTAFFHDRGTWDDNRKVLIVDLESKILIFLDQQHFQLLEKMRGILSHDEKELVFKITDKNQRHGLKTKNVIVRGFPSVFYCTTKQDPDEQEKTRLILLSASIEQEKLQESIRLISLRKGNSHEYTKQILEDERRVWLSNRIKGIRQTGIREVIIPNHEEAVCQRFLNKHRYLMPRHQRDFPRIMSLIKAHALLNCFHRERMVNGDGDKPITILASQVDIEAGFELYEKIADSNERGLSPYVYNIFETVIKPLGAGIKREDVQRKYNEIYHDTVH